MEEKQPRKSVRDELADKFVSILESDHPFEWTKGWSNGGHSLPYNGQTGRHYNGINRFVLMLKSLERGYTDPRFYTFKQVSEMEDCKIRAGEKATAVEYWLVWDTKNRRSMTFSQYAQLRRDDPSRKEEEFRIYPKTAYVFNAAQVEGLQPLPQPERTPLEEDRLAEEVISTMSENMGVPLIYGGDEAYYIPAKDVVHLPHKESFHSAADYYGTALHELSHSTSAPDRLDRQIVGYREDPEKYAIEELRAEIASTFVCAEIGLEMPNSVIENHMAYVSSWIQQIKDDHNVLFAAIKDADKIADYMIEQGRVEVLREKLAIEAQMAKPVEGMSYEIYQLKDIPENKALHFSDYAYASNFRLTESRYEKVYEAKAGEDDYSLDKIYYKFNVARPADFKGHSMSKSDVVVLNVDGQKTAWFVDTYGFQEVKNFSREPLAQKRGRAR